MVEPKKPKLKRVKANPSDLYYAESQAQQAVSNNGRIMIGDRFYHPLSLPYLPYTEAETVAKSVNLTGKYTAIVKKAAAPGALYIVFVRKTYEKNRFTPPKLIRETLSESGYVLKARYEHEVILLNKTGELEVWAETNNAPGYTIIIDGVDYVFSRKNKPDYPKRKTR